MAQVPLFNDNRNEEIYDGDTYYGSENSLSAPLTDNAVMDFKQAGIYNNLLKNINFLEIGSGMGGVLRNLSYFGKGHYAGIEPVHKAAIYSNRFVANDYNCKIYHQSLEKSDFNSDSFDFVFSFHTIEHLDDPTILLEKSYKWLKKDGKMLLGCPNFSGLIPRLKPLQWRARNKYHKWLIGTKELFPLLEDYGFKVEKYFTYGGFPAPRTFFQSMANKLFKIINMGDALFLVASKK